MSEIHNYTYVIIVCSTLAGNIAGNIVGNFLYDRWRNNRDKEIDDLTVRMKRLDQFFDDLTRGAVQVALTPIKSTIADVLENADKVLVREQVDGEYRDVPLSSLSSELQHQWIMKWIEEGKIMP